jgi:uracil-DNA glycosylase
MEPKEKELGELRAEVEKCRKCRLCGTRTQTVFGEGSADAEVLFIGEGPGKQEDLTGRPFVGRAGELLTRIIENGMGVPRSSVYIANLVKCRPTVDMKMERDRPPDPLELETCAPYLMKQVDIIRPKVIIALGSPSAKFLLNTATGITRIRGEWGAYRGIPVMPTYHPSYLLRNGGETSPLRRDVWNDIKKVMERIEWPVPARPKGGHR